MDKNDIEMSAWQVSNLPHVLNKPKTKCSSDFFQAKQLSATKLQMCPNLFPVCKLSNDFLQTAELRIVKRNLEKPR